MHGRNLWGKQIGDANHQCDSLLLGIPQVGTERALVLVQTD